MNLLRQVVFGENVHGFEKRLILIPLIFVCLTDHKKKTSIEEDKYHSEISTKRIFLSYQHFYDISKVGEDERMKEITHKKSMHSK